MSSSDYFYADVVGENRVQNFDRLPDIAQEILIAKIEEFADKVRDRAAEYLDERLHTRTGRLSGDKIDTEVTVQGKMVKARIFLANIPYARAQEEGATTPPHMIYPSKARVLRFIGATGEKVFAREVFHPGGIIHGKHFMRDARRDFGPEISRGLKKALVEGIRANMRRSS